MALEGGQVEKPNILVFFCDELRRDLLGCYDSPYVRTPHVDALAREAVVFDRCYTPTAICSPARASLMTGLYAHAHHMFNNSSPRYSYCQHLRPEVTLLPRWVATQTAYESAYFGKWHIGPNEDLARSGFEQTGTITNPPDGPLVAQVGNGECAGTLDLPFEAFPDVKAARSSQDFLRRRDRSRPFLLFCAFRGPHPDWKIPAEFGLRYRAEDSPIWPNRHDRFEGKPFYQKKTRILEHLYRYPFAADDDALRELLAYNFTYVELIDHLVGDVVATLKELGLYENTAILFSTDHGDMAGSHGFLCKGAYMYDEIYRIPLVFRPARGTARKRVAAPVQLMDVTATLLHLMAGTPQATMGQQTLHGESLLPFVDDSANWSRTVHYAEYHGDWHGHYSSRMVTDGRWKLAWNLTDRGELYDLEADPAELHNRFYDPACGTVRERYFDMLLAEGRRLQDGQLRNWHPDVDQRLADDTGGPLHLEVMERR